MSVQAITWAYEQSCKSPVTKFMLITIANYANDHNEAWPSKSRLSSDMDCCERTVRDNLRALEDAGLIEIEARFQDGVQLTNKIRLVGAPCRGMRGGDGSARGSTSRTPQGTTAAPDGDSYCTPPGVAAAPKPSLRTVNEPSEVARKRATTLPGSGKAYWSQHLDDPASSEGVAIVDGKLTLTNGTRTEWEERLGAKQLDLALIEIHADLKTTSPTEIANAVRKRLAKMARDKAASDERYAAAVERNGKSAAKPATRMSRY